MSDKLKIYGMDEHDEWPPKKCTEQKVSIITHQAPVVDFSEVPHGTCFRTPDGRAGWYKVSVNGRPAALNLYYGEVETDLFKPTDKVVILDHRVTIIDNAK